MRWFVFILFALSGCVLQTTLARGLSLFGATPDWLLIFVVFLGFYAPPKEAAIGAFVLGLIADVMSVEQLGWFTTSYVLAGLLVSASRDYLFRHRGMTRMMVVIVVALMMRGVWVVIVVSRFDVGRSFASLLLFEVTLTAIVTGLWAPLICAGLFRCLTLFGLERPRYTFVP